MAEDDDLVEWVRNLPPPTRRERLAYRAEALHARWLRLAPWHRHQWEFHWSVTSPPMAIRKVCRCRAMVVRDPADASWPVAHKEATVVHGQPRSIWVTS